MDSNTSSDVMMEQDGSLDDPTYIRVTSNDRTPTNQNVFPFSANVASFMVIEMVRLLVAEAWWPDPGGRMDYSMIPASLRYNREPCGEHCSIADSTALGDRYRYPFLVNQAVRAQHGALAHLIGLLGAQGAAILRVLGWRR